MTLWDYVWAFLADQISNAVTAMDDVTLFFGLSVWQLLMIFFVLDILAFIVAALFRRTNPAGGGNEK